MRGLGIAACFALALAGCAAAHAPEAVHTKPAGYNRRELPASQGLLTGPDGVWTVYRNDEPAAAPVAPESPAPPVAPEPAAAPEPKHREILMCDKGRHCEP